MDIIIDADLAAGQLRGTVGYDFVGVHVERRAGPALDAVGDKPRIQLTGDDLVAGLRDVFQAFVIQESALVVAVSAGFFNLADRADHLRMHPPPGDLEIGHGPLCLRAVEGLLRDFDFAQ